MSHRYQGSVIFASDPCDPKDLMTKPRMNAGEATQTMEIIGMTPGAMRFTVNHSKHTHSILHNQVDI